MARPAVDIVLRAKDLTRLAFDQASSRIRGLGVAGSRVSRLFAGGLGIAGVGAGLAGLSYALRSAVADLDALGKASIRAGVEAEELQGIRQFAERAGVATRGADVAMQRFTRRVGEAANGTGVLSKIFDELGIETRDASGHIRSTVDVLGDYQAALRNAGSAAERSRLAFAAFDTEGVGFGLGLANSNITLDAFLARAREIGVIVPNETVQAAEQLTDNMALLGEVVEATTLNALTPFIESVRDATDSFLAFIGAADAEQTLRSLPNPLREAKEELAGLNAELARAEALTAQQRARQGIASPDALRGRIEALRETVDLYGDEESIRERLAAIAADELARTDNTRKARRELSVEDRRRLATLLAEEAALSDALKVLELTRDAAKETADNLAGAAKSGEAFVAALNAEFERTLRDEERAAEAEERRLAAALASLDAQRVRQRQALEVVGLEGEALLLARQRHELELLDQRIADAKTDAERRELAALREQVVLRQQAEVAAQGAAAADETGAAATERQNVLLVEQVGHLQDIGGLLEDFEDSTEGWLRTLAGVLRIWEQLSQGQQSGGGIFAALGSAFGASRTLQVPVLAGGGQGASATAAPVNLTTNVVIEGVDYGADFNRRALEAADVIFAGQQAFAHSLRGG